jgi:thiol-disulfide isomerase/thioredoxin
VWILLCLTLRISAYSQASFTLEGSINLDSGSAELWPVANFAYLPGNRRLPYTSPIIKGRFRFQGSIDYPLDFKLIVQQKGTPIWLSDRFVLDTGYQSMTCNKDSLRQMPLMASKSMRELTGDFADQMHEANYFKGGWDEKQALRSAVLLDYIKSHPDSYVALWELIRQMDTKYSPSLASAFNELSDKIKNTYTGRALKANLDLYQPAGKAYFPQINVLDEKGSPVAFRVKKNSKYTLVDFWFSHCNPCISQFAALKQLNHDYKDRGFSILAVATDGKEYIGHWKAVIRQYQLPWSQYLDISGKEAEKLFIGYYPSNFLLDSRGIIIAKNIEPDQLAVFLKTSL